MCLAVPARIIQLDGDNAVVDAMGNRFNAKTTLVPEVKLGDIVLVHAGFAITQVDEEEAKETWALVITIVYTIILHLRLAPKIKGEFIFNVAAIFGFGSVIMTFIGVNYYFTKGMHSYANGDTPVFPMWAWIAILGLVAFIVIAWFKERYNRKHYVE